MSLQNPVLGNKISLKKPDNEIKITIENRFKIKIRWNSIAYFILILR